MSLGASAFGAFSPGKNVGDVHYDVRTGSAWIFLGDTYSNWLNWRLSGGKLSDRPDTAEWTSKHAGAFWYNNLTGQFEGWNGEVVVFLG